jgi:hypothetical protein
VTARGGAEAMGGAAATGGGSGAGVASGAGEGGGAGVATGAGVVSGTGAGAGGTGGLGTNGVATGETEKFGRRSFTGRSGRVKRLVSCQISGLAASISGAVSRAGTGLTSGSGSSS